MSDSPFIEEVTDAGDVTNAENQAADKAAGAEEVSVETTRADDTVTVEDVFGAEEESPSVEEAAPSVEDVFSAETEAPVAEAVSEAPQEAVSEAPQEDVVLSLIHI